MKKNYKTNPIIIIIIVVVFAFLILLTKTDSLLEVERYNTEGELQNTEQIVSYKTSELTQSFFSETINSFSLQSTVPSEEKDLSIMKASIKNDLNEYYHINSVDIFKGSKKVHTSTVNILLKPGEEYIYKSPEIDMETQEGIKETITMIFKVFTESQQEIQFDYSYEYIQLTQCNSDSQCSGALPICDLDNVARFGSEQKKYCVRPCVTSANCYEGQICRNLRCGY